MKEMYQTRFMISICKFSVRDGNIRKKTGRGLYSSYLLYEE